MSIDGYKQNKERHNVSSPNLQALATATWPREIIWITKLYQYVQLGILSFHFGLVFILIFFRGIIGGGGVGVD